MGHMKYENTKPYEDSFWKKNRISLLKDEVISIDGKSKTLFCKDSHPLEYDYLVIACGSVPNKFGWPGQDLNGVRGLYSYQDLDYLTNYTPSIKRAVIVGGGLIGVEMAEMFHSRHIGVDFLVRESSFWKNILPSKESELVNREIRRNGINLRLSTELKEIVSDNDNSVKSVMTSKNEEIECDFVGLTVGVRPNIDFLKQSSIEIDKGVLVNEYFETNVEDVYAIGDCAQFRSPLPDRRPIEQVWYTGRMHGETVAQTICTKKTNYNPGIWFNSAKFFNIEYQTYGIVPPHNSHDQQSFYWEHPDRKKLIHIVYEKATRIVKGFNFFGIRYRHHTCNEWIEKGMTIDYVIDNLHIANFDPEFFKRYEKVARKTYTLTDQIENI